MIEVEVCEVPHGSSEYIEALALRDAALRVPLGLSIKDDDLSDEVNQRHFAMRQVGSPALIGCLSAVPYEGAVKLRQMAIADGFRRQGLGSLLVTRVEALLKGEERIIVHAREYALGFYTQLGYHTVGDRFVEVGIPHFRMEKEL
ncbi:hypothetical protein KIPB_005955 [Kipferlia bialata]|uniref:N-acetyltransferase domain-containing protein n=1 Tax=Kipferlia bialata TaxID=797122 RepID=A0A9K3GJG3_9EUKA|nr:hypothetical protein KIPB_000667 [Kipferlia bialata]GIQ84461.1 hypothetical protein KIPB_005955 [Kipferlia bialata]|eukprot:g667.t1